MFLVDSARRLIGSIHVVEAAGEIKISGLPADFISSGIMKHWGTSKIEQYFFNSIKKSSLSFASFFAPDFVYMLEALSANKKIRINRRALQAVIHEMYTSTWLKNTTAKVNSKFDYTQLKFINLTLRPHQLEFLHTFDEKTQQYGLNGYLLGAAPGSGKTLNGLALELVGGADVVVMIVPKQSVERVWDDTIRNNLTSQRKWWISTSGEPLQYGCTHYVFHYEQLERAIEFFSKLKGRYKKPGIIVDECHNFNDPNSQRTQDLITLCKLLASDLIIFASGTPVKAMGGELIPFITATDPLFTADVAFRFKKIFGISSTRGADILANRIGFTSFKVDKQEVVGNEVVVTRADVKMPNSDQYTLNAIREQMRVFIEERWKFYDEHKNEFYKTYHDCLTLFEKSQVHNAAQKQAFVKYVQLADGFHHHELEPKYNPDEAMYCNGYEKNEIIPCLPPKLKDPFRSAKSVYKYVHLKIQGEALGRIVGGQRTQCAVDMVRNMENMKLSNGEVASLFDLIDDSEKKTVLFTSYVDVVDEMEKYLQENGYQPLKVYGDTNKDLPAIIKYFDESEDANPLIATFQSLSTAVPLIMANTIVMLNSPFRPYEYEQTLSRVDRMGQTEIVRCFNVFLDTGGEPNISTRSNDILMLAREIVGSIMGVDVNDVATMESINDQSTWTPSKRFTAALESLRTGDIDDFVDLAFVQSPAIPLTTPAWTGW